MVHFGWLDAVVARLKLWRVEEVGPGVRVRGRVLIHGGGHIHLGWDVTLDGGAMGVELHAEPGAHLVLGDGVTLESGASVEAQTRVDIGRGCHLGRLSKVMDNHFHPVGGNRHQRPPSRPVVLEENVTLGEGAIVLPGAHLEAGVTLRPGTVASRRVKAGLCLEGNPPRVVRPPREGRGASPEAAAPPRPPPGEARAEVPTRAGAPGSGPRDTEERAP